MDEPKPKRRRWYQFSLRTLLIVVLVLSLPLGWIGWKLEKAREQRKAVEAILKEGASVWYDYQMKKETGVLIPGAEPPGPAWLRKLLGDDVFADVVQVFLRGDNVDSQLKQIKGFTKMRTLHTYKHVTDAGLEHITGMKELKILSLDGSQITDEGLAHLSGLTELRLLMLSRTQITDAGLRHLNGLTKLTGLHVVDTRVTDDGAIELQEVLPNCEIVLRVTGEPP